MARRKARELAFRTLFMAERSDTPVLDVWEDVRQELHEEGNEDTDEAYGEPLTEAGIAFAGSLVEAWAEQHERVDGTILGSLEGWTFNQMNQTDLNVLRLAVTELLADNDVPPEVTIEMAVRQARKFGGEESGRFVNGVLGRVFRNGEWGPGRE
ncbi:MAG TPA: transcription antitermination factor NusB [Deinococcales bacterium]|nr:transcription antitermination factor NusB [Deinococcales bacterium]